MQPIPQLHQLVRTLTPSELDDINELKAAFLKGLILAERTLEELHCQRDEVEDATQHLGARLVEMRAELAVLLARWAAIEEREGQLVDAAARLREEGWSTGRPRRVVLS